MPQLDGQSMQKLFALEAKKHLSLQNRKSSLQLRVRRQLSREGTTVLQKEGAPINALPLQRSPLPLYTKKKKKRSPQRQTTTGFSGLTVQHQFSAVVLAHNKNHVAWRRS